MPSHRYKRWVEEFRDQLRNDDYWRSLAARGEGNATVSSDWLSSSSLAQGQRQLVVNVSSASEEDCPESSPPLPAAARSSNGQAEAKRARSESDSAN